MTNQKPRLTKRSHKEFPTITSGAVEVDVRAQSLDVLDPQIGEQVGRKNQNSMVYTNTNSSRCIPVENLILPASLCLTTILSMLSVIAYMTLSQRKSKI